MPRKAVRRRIARKPRRVPRKGRKTDPAGINHQMARITETIEFGDKFPAVANAERFALSQFYRATTLAPQFKYYRAVSVLWQYKGLYNTFQENANATPTKPYLYTAMNRTQDASWLTSASPLFAIQAMGAKPRALTGTITLKYRPNWCLGGLPAAGFNTAPPQSLQSLYVTGNTPSYNWISCPPQDSFNSAYANPQLQDNNITSLVVPLKVVDNIAANVTYNGHISYIEQENVSVQTQACKLLCTVVWEFKGTNLDFVPAPPGVTGDTGVTA